ncbi:hypothetical protein Clacol_000113 [Clathrus columnatus]|uniref:HNH nuclease domain-containing protein n=1 Tax=Clathrus columnatus TaxID=1419009 RepID=A0AAV4ZW75_9AGAM|nr:hypothetical protein Clacol_000113 [Clathrus columnatus]
MSQDVDLIHDGPGKSGCVDVIGFLDSGVVESTPLSLILTLASPKTETKRRGILPNQRHCLIENCSSSRAVEYCHYVPKSFAFKDELMSNIEWHWNMKYYNLNLNSSHNIFCGKRVGVALRRLFNKHDYLLLPETDIIDRYHNTLTFDGIAWVAKRELFPIIPMTKIAIHRQNRIPPPGTVLGPTDFITHVFPFVNLPLFQSHLHPRFVILEAGRKMVTEPQTQNAITAHPILAKVLQLYLAWTCAPPPEAKIDESYHRLSGDDDSKCSNDDDTDTNAGRLQSGWKRKREGRGGSFILDTSGLEKYKRTAHGEPERRERNKSIRLSAKTLIEHEQTFDLIMKKNGHLTSFKFG